MTSYDNGDDGFVMASLLLARFLVSEFPFLGEVEILHFQCQQMSLLKFILLKKVGNDEPI